MEEGDPGYGCSSELGREPPAMSSDLPGVAPRISNHGAPVPVWGVLRLLEWLRTALNRAPEDGVGALDVDVKKRWHRLTIDRRCDHQKRGADPKLRGSSGMEAPRRAKDVLDEL